MNQGRPRTTENLPAVRQFNTFDVWMKGITVFTGKLTKQLGITLLATLLGAGRDWVLKSSSNEVSKRLGGNMGGENSEEQKNLYGNRNGYGNGYNSNTQYATETYQRRSNGMETFPGF